MPNYQRLNNTLGWFCFAVASITYFLTMEPSASYWDCGEFISCIYRMQVAHQPGAPLFTMLYKVITLLAGDNLDRIAYYSNFGSVLASGFTILFLFWTITALAKKLVLKQSGELNAGNIFLIMGSGLVGALAYTFSDTFWFSAVESEVYALSSLCTAIVFWAIFKWENHADEPGADRWLIFIAYVMGLSIGVHLLNLLAIPAISLVYYFKRYKYTRNGAFWAFVVSCLILLFIQYGIIPGLVSLAAKFDLLFVNVFGLPFDSGMIFFILLLAGGMVWALHYSIHKRKAVLNTALLCLTYIIIGYSSYAMIVIRAKADPHLNNSDPDNAISLLSYLNREQYGDRPLIYGQYFDAEISGSENGDKIYRKGEKKYEVAGYKPKYNYEGTKTLFPRIYSSQDNHVSLYRTWLNIPEGAQADFGDNLRFFFEYQINYMYLRYFMWNFAGRVNDEQGIIQGQLDGNWMSGIRFIDEARLGNMDKLPRTVSENPAHNKLYMLPLLLGIIGLLYQYKADKRDSLVVFLLFFFTGLAIVLYLNQTPIQPRERDYAYAGSFYAFCIWIGLGVMGVSRFLARKLNQKVAALLSTAICLLAVPVLMASQEWDDHDRSGRYVVRDIAANYLNSVGPNGIIFTYGDNDTYPLWYAQEVEYIRPDVRVINLSLLGTDWYGRQMKDPMNESPAIPISWENEKFVAGVRDAVPFFDRNIEGYTNLKQVIGFVGSDSREAKVQLSNQEYSNYVPTNRFQIPVDAEAAIQSGAALPTDSLVDAVRWTVSRSAFYKNDLLQLDIIANSLWERPVYFASTIPGRNMLGMNPYLRNDGLALRITPVVYNNPDPYLQGSVNDSILYDNLMNKFKWGGLESGNIYVDPETRRMLGYFRLTFNQLADTLYKQGKIDSCVKVIDRMNEVLPDIYSDMGYLQRDMLMAELYYKCEQPEKGDGMMNDIVFYLEDQLDYFASLDQRRRQVSFRMDMQNAITLLLQSSETAQRYQRTELADKLKEKIAGYASLFGMQMPEE